MLEQLLSLVQENSQEAIVQNPAVPNQQNDAVMDTLVSSITGGLQQQIQGGNIQGLMSLFSGQSLQGGGSISNNPIVSQITQTAIKSIMEKFGLNNGAASGIVASVLPGVISSLISKISNPKDGSLDFSSVIGSLTGGNAAAAGGFDFNQIGYALADGKLDMNDLMNIGSSFLGGNKTNQSGQSQGGDLNLGGLLGGLFGGK